MAKLLTGGPVAQALTQALLEKTGALRREGIVPTLAMVRLGENAADLSYERGAKKRCEAAGVQVRQVVLEESTTRQQLEQVLEQLNRDDTVHGVLLFRPLPSHLQKDQQAICDKLDPKKDVDGMTSLSAAGVFTGQPIGFAPCTPAACLELMDHYGIGPAGKNIALIGRSLVVGRPLAMLLTAKNATVTLCHTRTRDTARICREADVIITAAGKLKSLTREYVKPGQTVIDVSINFDPQKVNARGGLGALAGDADLDAVSDILEAITPVPGGVGAVTSAVLVKHTVEAAEKTR